MRVATSDCSRNKVKLKSSKLSHVNWLNIINLVLTAITGNFLRTFYIISMKAEDKQASFS
jgi:hypothetical protein